MKGDGAPRASRKKRAFAARGVKGGAIVPAANGKTRLPVALLGDWCSRRSSNVCSDLQSVYSLARFVSVVFDVKCSSQAE